MAADALDKHDTITVDQWKSIIDAVQRHGVGVISFVGGEPLIRFKDMVALCRHARAQSDVWTVTTGWGLSRDKAAELADAGLRGAAVSLDHYEPEKHNDFRRNKKAFDAAVRSIELFAGAGIFPALAICSTRDIVEGDGLYRFIELARELKVGFVQIVEPIRSGAYIGDHDVALTEAELRKLQAFQREINTSTSLQGIPVRRHQELGRGQRYRRRVRRGRQYLPLRRPPGQPPALPRAQHHLRQCLPRRLRDRAHAHAGDVSASRRERPHLPCERALSSDRGGARAHGRQAPHSL